MKIQPINDRIVVKPAEKEATTPSGLVLPDTAQEKPLKGEVIAVGPGKMLDSGKLAVMEVKVGDVVLYGKYAGTEVRIGRDEYVILRQEDVLAIIEAEKAQPKRAVVAAGKGRK